MESRCLAGWDRDHDRRRCGRATAGPGRASWRPWRLHRTQGLCALPKPIIVPRTESAPTPVGRFVRVRRRCPPVRRAARGPAPGAASSSSAYETSARPESRGSAPRAVASSSRVPSAPPVKWARRSADRSPNRPALWLAATATALRSGSAAAATSRSMTSNASPLESVELRLDGRSDRARGHPLRGSGERFAPDPHRACCLLIPPRNPVPERAQGAGGLSRVPLGRPDAGRRTPDAGRRTRDQVTARLLRTLPRPLRHSRRQGCHHQSAGAAACTSSWHRGASGAEEQQALPTVGPGQPWSAGSVRASLRSAARC
jgi:hypothetical protein